MLNASNLPEIVFASSDSQISRQISDFLEKGILIKLLPRVYTANLQDDLEKILERNLFLILGKLYPKAVLSHQSALEMKPTSNGNLYLTYTYTRNIDLLHLRLRLIKGPGPGESDNPLSGDLFLSCLERACLENLQVSRKGADGEKRTVEKEVIEQRLIDILRVDGEKGLNDFRDKARGIAESLGMEKEFAKLNQIIGALLATKSSKVLNSPLAIATALGEPYDSYRVDLFWKLFAALKSYPFPHRAEQFSAGRAFENFAFFEAYFSNYIEGTEFEIEEAKDIVFNGVFIENRTGDTHDIKGTYELVSSPYEMSKTPASSEVLIDLLQSRHAAIMRGRPDKSPGQFKKRVNRAGNTTFVEPDLVRGTIKEGFGPYQALDHPLAKAIFMMFMVSEIHPFEDGNGRVARVMMNAELVKAQTTRIIIPTVYREDYLLALRKLSRRQMPDAFIRMMDRAHQFSHQLPAADFDLLLQSLKSSDAFLEPHEGKLKF